MATGAPISIRAPVVTMALIGLHRFKNGGISRLTSKSNAQESGEHSTRQTCSLQAPSQPRARSPLSPPPRPDRRLPTPFNRVLLDLAPSQ